MFYIDHVFMARLEWFSKTSFECCVFVGCNSHFVLFYFLFRFGRRESVFCALCQIVGFEDQALGCGDGPRIDLDAAQNVLCDYFCF